MSIYNSIFLNNSQGEFQGNSYVRVLRFSVIIIYCALN